MKLFWKIDGKTELILESDDWGMVFRHFGIYKKIAEEEKTPMPFLVS